MADPLQLKIQALGTGMTGDEAARVLRGYIQNALSAQPSWYNVTQQLFGQDNTPQIQAQNKVADYFDNIGQDVVIKPSDDWNKLVVAVGICDGLERAADGERDVIQAAQSEAVGIAVQGAVQFGGKALDAVSGVANGVLDTAEGALFGVAWLGRLLPLIIVGGLAFGIYLLVKKPALLGKFLG